METERIAAYSPNTIYGQLSSPFTPKQIHINAHTEFDKDPAKETFSRSDFSSKTPTKIKVDYSSLEKPDVSKYQKKSEEKVVGFKNDQNNSEKTQTQNVNSFTASSLSNKDIVNNSLKKGYSVEQVAVVLRAKDAYNNSSTLTKNPIKTLSTRVYNVH